LCDIVVDDNIMEGYVTVAEAARRLNRSIEQVRRYLREGKLPGRRIGLQWFIEEQALEGWAPRGRAAGVSEAVAKYEAGTMETKEKMKAEPLISEETWKRIDALREAIRKESGEFDVVAMVRKDREEH
jgi:excisionase family DNA binding protein